MTYHYGTDKDPSWVAWQELEGLGLLEKYAGETIFFSDGLLLARMQSTHDFNQDRDTNDTIAKRLYERTQIPVLIHYVPKEGEYILPETIGSMAVA